MLILGFLIGSTLGGYLGYKCKDKISTLIQEYQKAKATTTDKT